MAQTAKQASRVLSFLVGGVRSFHDREISTKYSVLKRSGAYACMLWQAVEAAGPRKTGRVRILTTGSRQRRRGEERD